MFDIARMKVHLRWLVEEHGLSSPGSALRIAYMKENEMIKCISCF